MIMRVVLDTNTLVSAVISAVGPPRRLLDGARAQAFDLYSSPILLGELLDVLSRDKFASRLALAGLRPRRVVAEIRRIAHVVVPGAVQPIIAADPDDDHVLACAVTGQVDLIVSSDRHLLDLGSEFAHIRILTAAEAMTIVDDRGASLGL